MQTWGTTLSRAFMMGLAWAMVWVPIGMLAGARVVGELEPEHIGGPLYASVLCGALFSGLAGVASGRRRVRDLTLSRAASWGAASGALVGSIPFILGEDFKGTWLLAIAIFAFLIAACAISATASPLVARWLGGQHA